MESSKSKKPMNEVPCESPFPSQPTGCCMDGRKCDEICVAIAAEEYCRKVGHVHVEELECREKCCNKKTNETASVCNPGTDHCCAESMTASEDIGTWHKEGCCSGGSGAKEEDKISVTRKDSGCPGEQTCVNDEEVAMDSCEPACCTAGEKDQAYAGSAAEIEKKDDLCYAKSERFIMTAGISDEEDKHDDDFGCKPRAPSVRAKKKVDSCCDAQPLSFSSSQSANEAVIADSRDAYSAHLEQAILKYTAYLEAGICICRNVLSRIETCCDQKKRTATFKKRKSCSAVTVHDTGSVVKRSKNNHGVAAGKSNCKKSCCTKKAISTEKDGYCKSNVDKITHDSQREKDDCTDEEAHCCKKTAAPAIGDVRIQKDQERLQKKATTRVRADDIEQGAAREHVSFSILGMTCTGCIKKITGVLDHVDGVEVVNINFVAALGDIDVDTSKIGAEKALQQLERETGFKCSRIVSDYQTLDVLMGKVEAQSLSTLMLNGMMSIEKAGKAYRLSFDPLVIGAREVVARSEGKLAPPSNDGAIADGRRRFILKLWSFIAAATLTIPVVILAWGDTGVPSTTRSIISLVLGTCVQAIAVPEFYTPALKALVFSKSIEMDMLVVISITAAYGYSVIAFGLTHSGVELEQGELFETSTLLITLVLLGRLVSTYAKVRAVQAVSMRSFQAETAYLENDSGHSSEIDARLLEFNDIIKITPHSKIVSDGQVVRGKSAVDESMLTGESLPVSKAVGDTVIAGTLNGPGPLSVRLTRLPGQNSITDIINLVQNALSAKPRIQDLADVLAGWFVPVVIAVSTIVFIIWLVVALKIRGENGGGAVGLSITYAIAVLAISCPCALGLAVPLVLVVAGGVAAKAGVIIKQADAMERGFKVTDVIFDKTGTLTDGDLHVLGEEMHGNELTDVEALSLASALVKDNEHPVSQAVAKSLRARNIQPFNLKGIKSVPGAGIEAVWKSSNVRAGNPFWLDVASHPSVASLLAGGLTPLCVSLDGRPVMSFSLKASLRVEAVAVIRELSTRGITCHVVSGDQPTVVSDVASLVNIQPSKVASRQSPADKQAYVQNLIAVGKTTLFVGDGTNDAVAIAQANVGVQIGSASDVTRATSDVVLLCGLDGILTLLDISKQSYYRIIFNFAWSAIYNILAILLAAGAFIKVRIPPSYAGLGEIVSVLPVVFVAMSLMKVKVGKH